MKLEIVAVIKQYAFLLSGLGSIAVYIAFAVFYAASYKPGSSLHRELFNLGNVALLLLFYAQGYWALKQTSLKVLPAIMGFCAVFALVSLFICPFYSGDLWGYVNRGWEQVHYGLNPYVSVVSDIPHWWQDGMFRAHWIDNPCPYGFLFALWAKVLCQLGQGHWAQTVLLFKVGNIICHAVIGFLIYRASQYLKYFRPELALYLYLWNPLIILQSLANGHNDILMSLFIMLGLFCAITQAWLWVLPALMAAVFIKYAAIVIVPWAFLFIGFQKNWRTAFYSALLGLGLGILISLPYIDQWQAFRWEALGENAIAASYSLQTFLNGIYKLIVFAIPSLAQTQEGFKTALNASFCLGFVLLNGAMLFYLLKKRSFSQASFLRLALGVMLLLIFMVSRKFYPWYIVMFFPIAFLLPAGDWLRTLVLLIASFGLLGFTFVIKAKFLNYMVLNLLPIAWILYQQCNARLPNPTTD